MTSTRVWVTKMTAAMACGAGLGAHLQPRLPETLLRLLLGTLATAIGALYAVEILT